MNRSVVTDSLQVVHARENYLTKNSKSLYFTVLVVSLCAESKVGSVRLRSVLFSNSINSRVSVFEYIIFIKFFFPKWVDTD